MFSRPFQKINNVKTYSESKILGKFYFLPGTPIKVYVPSWTLDVATFPKNIILEHSESDVLNAQTLLTVTSDLTEGRPINELSDIALAQNRDKKLSKFLFWLKNNVDKKLWKFDKVCEETDFLLKSRSKFFFNRISNVLFVKNNEVDQIVVPRELVGHYLRICHDENGHFGVDRISHCLRNAWWIGKSLDIDNFVSSCVFCQQRKGNYMQRSKVPMKNLDHGSKPFESISIDFVHMPQSKNGKKYFVTICCNFSRFLYCHPTVRDRAEDAISALEAFVLEHGPPKVIHIDRGVHFINSLFQKFCTQFSMKHQIHTAYRPQSSGQIERIHRTLKNSLWILCNSSDLDWAEALPYVRRAHNISYNSATKISPFFCVFGYDPDITGLINAKSNHSSPASYSEVLVSNLEKAYKAIRISQSEADAKSRDRNRPILPVIDIEPDDYVYLHRSQSVVAKETHMNWIGPYKVTQVYDSIVEIQLNDQKLDFVHRSHVVKVITRFEHLENDKGNILNSPTPEDISNNFLEKSQKYSHIFLDADPLTPKRSRLPTKRLQMDPSKKTYS